MIYHTKNKNFLNKKINLNSYILIVQRIVDVLSFETKTNLML